MKIGQILAYRDMCNVCGQTPCNCTHVMEGADERGQKRLWAQITDYEKRAKATSNDIKKQHLLKMADELRGKLKTSDLNEFAPGNGDDREPNEEEILRQLASRWWSGTEQQMAQAQRTLETLGWEIGPDESGDEDAGVYVYRIGDDDGRDTIAFSHSELSLDEAKKKKKSSRSLRGYFFPGYAYYGSGESGEGGGDGGGESINRGMAEGAGNVGNAIRALYQKIYRAGDDEIEYFYNDSPIFAQYWDEYEGDLDSIIAEVDPGELQVILDELESYVQNANLAEGWTKLPSGDYINQHTGVRSSKPPVKKKRGEKTGADWDAIEKAKKDKEQGVAEGSLNEFAPGGNSASSYYAVTANFVNEFSQQKQEQLQDLIDAGWTKQDLAQAGTLEGNASDIAHFEQVRDGFLKGLKPGFDAYLRGDTQLKDQLGAYWMENDLPLNQDWEKIYGEPWGDDSEYNEGIAEAPGAETLAHNQSTVASNEKAFDLEEGKPKEKEADYGADYQDMVARVKKLAGLGPLKTVYDPQKRVYKNIPTAVQPKK